MNREASYSYSCPMQVIELDCLAYDLSGASNRRRLVLFHFQFKALPLGFSAVGVVVGFC